METKPFELIYFVFLLIYRIFNSVKNFCKCVIFAFSLPGPRALPFLGNILILKNNEVLLDLGTNGSLYFGTIFRAWVFFVPSVFIYEPEHLKIILSNSKISEKNFFYQVMHTFIGDGLITNNGEKWRRNRKLIQHYFQNKIIETYYDTFAQASEEMVQQLSNKHNVNITGFVNTCVLNILHRAVLGVDLKSSDNTPFRSGELLIIKRFLKPWLLFDTIFNYSEMSKQEKKQNVSLHHYVKEILNLRIQERKNRKITDTCFLDHFIELIEGNHFSKEDAINETVTFMLAGQDSVGGAVAFTLYYLAKHQDIQEKVFREIEEVLSGNSVNNINMNHIDQLHYLEQCIKESLRLTPSVPLLARVLTNEVVLGKYTLPAGMTIFISPFITHRLPHVFHNPLDYNPDRFSPENFKNIPQYGFIPFSAGSRNCIGYKFAYMEMKAIISNVIRNFHISMQPGKENISLAFRVTLRVSSGIFLQIKPRNKV